MFCAGFLEGKWRKVNADDELDHLDIPLVRENADAIVIRDKEKDRVRLGQPVEEARAAKGQAKIKYHTIVD